MAEIEKAVFAAGCFWGVESAFRKLRGVVDVVVGYAGGSEENPTYEDICAGLTGHAEAVEVSFDPDQVGYGTLVELFWTIHDPTQVDRQGPDIGRQYRSAIFTNSSGQAEIARFSKKAAQTRFSAPLATSVEPAGPFWKAEEHHQRYIEKRGG